MIKNLIGGCSFVLLIGALSSCDAPSSESMASSIGKIEESGNRAAKEQVIETKQLQAIDRFSLADITVDLETMDQVAMQQMSAEDADAQAVMNINQALMGAEKTAQLLDVKFSMSEEPVENGMFIFSIESSNAKELTLEMFDEEGFNMAANNHFAINEGNNYKALNVKEMDNGAYVFRLKDAQGKELVRTVDIENE